MLEAILGLVSDKGFLATVLGSLFIFLNKKLNFGMSDAQVGQFAALVAAYVVGHFIHKGAETHATITSGGDSSAAQSQPKGDVKP